MQEDADLFSINYLHFGAPKVWYCVSPSQRAKFERMCQVRGGLGWAVVGEGVIGVEWLDGMLI